MAQAASPKYVRNWDLDSLLPHPAGEDFPKVIDEYRRDLNALADRSDRLPAVGPGTQNARSWGAFLCELERVVRPRQQLGQWLGEVWLLHPAVHLVARQHVTAGHHGAGALKAHSAGEGLGD